MTETSHLLDLIRAVRPRTAVFTTYTFSVSYFDAVFVPTLRSVGCQDISVLVDADQAALSAQESRSRAAGRTYRIASVTAPGGGVFHPKLAYLMAEDADVLAVLSGNLTASGQSLQLESFDAISADAAPSVFRELADWMADLAERVAYTSPQATDILTRTAPRARRAAQRKPAPGKGSLPPPALVQTLTSTARESLEAMFIADADEAQSVVVLSPFHAPDGGPLLRLANSLGAGSLVVGLDASTSRLVAPFDKGRFKPTLPSSYVRADARRAHRRLHAKLFELHAEDKVLVMTGSVNATAQSFESTKNVEVSLARWLPASPFLWVPVEPEAYEATQKNTDFQAPQPLIVDAWLCTSGVIEGQVTARGHLPSQVELTLQSGDLVHYVSTVQVDADGHFNDGPVAGVEALMSILLTVASDNCTASCWLNMQEILELAMEERERRAAVARVLRGDYAAEDVAEVVRLLTSGTQALITGEPAALRTSRTDATAGVGAPFSFSQWEKSGQQRGTSTSLARNPTELLRAITRWLNRDLVPVTVSGGSGPDSGSLPSGVRLQGPPDGGASGKPQQVDPYHLLDQLCLLIPTALERQEATEYSGVLAEVVASRALERALKQDLQMAPCLSWLDRFSRFSYPDSSRGDILAVATALACVAAMHLERQGTKPPLAVLREALERIAGEPLAAERLRSSCEAGLVREMFRRIPGSDHSELKSCSGKVAETQSLGDSLLVLLRKATTHLPHLLADEPEALTFPEVVEARRHRKLKKADLRFGLLTPERLTKSTGCPLCSHELSKHQLATLRQKHVLMHKDPRCNYLLLLADNAGRIQRGIEELPDA